MPTACRFFVAASVLVALAAPRAVAQIDLSSIYVSSFAQNVIYSIDRETLEVEVFADSGDGLDGPSALVFDPRGLLLVSNFGRDEILLFTAPGVAEVVIASSEGLDGPFGQNGLALDAEGNLYVAEFSASEVTVFPAGGGPGIVFADAADGLVHPDGLVFTPEGDLLIANRDGGNIIQVAPNGVSNILINTSCEPYTIDVRSNGDVYYACNDGQLFRWPEGDPLQEVSVGIYGSGINNYGIGFSSNDLALFMVTDDNGNLLAIDPLNGDEAVLVPGPELEGGVSVAMYRAVPQITFEGECPGTLTASVVGATPLGNVGIVRGLERGESFVPGGPCDGTRLQLLDPQVAGGFIADADGRKQFTFEIDELNCGGFIQALDVTSCFAGNVIPVDPDAIP